MRISRRSPSGLAALLAGFAVALTACTAPPQTAPPAPTPSSPTPASNPTTAAPSQRLARLPAGVTQRAVLGDPWSNQRSKVHAVALSALQLVDSAQRGQTLTMSMFNLTFSGAADALIRADRRGVAVHVLLNAEGAQTRQSQILRAGLGSDRGKRSWVVIRGGGLRMHSKFLLLTPRGKGGPTIWVSSGNLSASNGRDQANEALITHGDQKLYDFLLRQFTLMRKDVKDPANLGRVATTSSAVVRTFPLPQGGPANDPVLAFLSDVTCRRGKDRTVVRMAQLYLTIERLYLTAKLRELAAAGCDLRIVAHRRGLNPIGILQMQAKGPGRVPLRVADGTILHTKITSVDGWDGSGRRIKAAMVGSHNLTGRALSRTPEGANDELSLRIWDAKTVGIYNAWIDRLIAKHSKRPTVP